MYSPRHVSMSMFLLDASSRNRKNVSWQMRFCKLEGVNGKENHSEYRL